MAGGESITLTSAEVHALGERLRARATSVILHDALSQQSDRVLAAGAPVHLVAELIAGQGFVAEARAVLRAALAGAAWITVDDTGARRTVKNGFCTQIDNRFLPLGRTDPADKREKCGPRRFSEHLRADLRRHRASDIFIQFQSASGQDR